MPNIKFTDNSRAVLKALEEKKELALQAVGAEAVTYAFKDAPVDSGRLRNSIAWATKAKTDGAKGNPAKAENYTPNGTPEDDSVYIGTNVEYAAKQEYGDYKHKVGQKHFLKNAAANHNSHYKSILMAALNSGS